MFDVHCTSQLHTYRIGSWEIVTPHDLHVGFLKQRYPQFIAVVRERAQEGAMFVHRQIVINNNL